MNLLKAASTVSLLTLASRITGLVRDQLIAASFGAGAATDAFNVAFRIPNLLRRLFGEGAFSQAFVPILGATREREGEAATRALIETDEVAPLIHERKRQRLRQVTDSQHSARLDGVKRGQRRGRRGQWRARHRGVNGLTEQLHRRQHGVLLVVLLRRPLARERVLGRRERKAAIRGKGRLEDGIELRIQLAGTTRSAARDRDRRH